MHYGARSYFFNGAIHTSYALHLQVTSICSVNRHISCKLVLVAEAVPLVPDLAVSVEEKVVSWGWHHPFCNLLTCNSIFLGMIYIILWPASPRYVYQHGQYNLVVVIVPVWAIRSDSGLCSGCPPATGLVRDIYVMHHWEQCWVSICFSFLLSCHYQNGQKQAGSPWRKIPLTF